MRRTPPRPGARRRILVAAAVLGLATTGTVDASAEQSPGALTLDEPSTAVLLGDRTVTLLTGERMTVSSDPGGRLSVTPIGAGSVPSSADRPASAADVQVTGIEAPGKPVVLSAVPPSATALVDAGVVDRRLFDLNALATGGFGEATTPVTVHFAGVTPSADAQRLAEALPGSSYVSGTATSGRATVSVPVGDSEKFWDAVTTPRSFDPATPQGQAWAHNRDGAPRDLADGLAGLTLDGAPLAIAPASTVPTYTLTVRLHASADPARWSWGDQAGVSFSTVSAPLIGVTGPKAANLVNPSFACLGDKPQCATVVMTYAVPVGVYYLHAHFGDRRDTLTHTTYFHEPEVAVNSDRVIDLHMDDGMWIDPRTPRPSDPMGYGLDSMRTLPDGLRIYNIATSNADNNRTGYYLAPTKRPARTGAFNMQVTSEWHEPYVTLTTDRGLNLRAAYPNASGHVVGVADHRPQLSLRNTSLGVVDVGTGTPADFAAVDVRGKLAVLGADPDQQVACGVEKQVMDRAIAAGATAVVFDPRTDSNPIGTCDIFHSVPVVEDGHSSTSDLPLISVMPDEARQLREQLAQRRVTIRVDSPGHAAMGYLYELGQHFSGGVPATIDQTVSARGLATRNTILHSPAGKGNVLGLHAFSPGFNLSVNWAMELAPLQTPGRSVTEYVSTSPDVRWRRSWTRFDTALAEGSEKVTESVRTPDKRTERWFNPSQSVGPVALPDDLGSWTDWSYCNFCRKGDVLSPLTAVNHPEPNHESGMGWLPETVLTDGDGQPVPLNTDDPARPVFRLAAQEQQYTLESTMPGGHWFQWRFRSGQVTGNQMPPGTICLDDHSGVDCGAPQPLIYLRYVAPVDATNTAAARSRHTVTVTPYHQATDAPAIREVATQVSFDGGTTWTDASTRSNRDGTWSATFTVPALADTDGHVTLRTTATDEDDNSTTQLRTNAYALR
ncbi:protease-associated domain-containing protein [Actinophytocola sediminis]